MRFKGPAIVIDPATPRTLYFGDKFGVGVFKSTNAEQRRRMGSRLIPFCC